MILWTNAISSAKFSYIYCKESICKKNQTNDILPNLVRKQWRTDLPHPWGIWGYDQQEKIILSHCSCFYLLRKRKFSPVVNGRQQQFYLGAQNLQLHSSTLQELLCHCSGATSPSAPSQNTPPSSPKGMSRLLHLMSHLHQKSSKLRTYYTNKQILIPQLSEGDSPPPKKEETRDITFHMVNSMQYISIY